MPYILLNLDLKSIDSTSTSVFLSKTVYKPETRATKLTHEMNKTNHLIQTVSEWGFKHSALVI